MGPHRDLLEAAHGDRAGVRAQTLAVYRLIDDLRQRHPGLLNPSEAVLIELSAT